MSGNTLRISANVQLAGSLQFTLDSAGFPSNPQPGTLYFKDQCLFAFVKIGQLTTWYPFSTPTQSYIHTQGVAATRWTVTHNLGLPLSALWVQAQDENGALLFGSMVPNDNNSFFVDFASPQLGSIIVVAPNSINVSEVQASLLTIGGSVVINSTGITINGQQVLTNATLTPAEIGAVATSAVGAASGVASLDANSKLPVSQLPTSVATLDGTGKLQLSQLPAIAITDTYVVASQAAMLALTAQMGDVAVRTDLSESFILAGSDPSVLANWQALLHPASGVSSVNGMTGAVTLTASNITGLSTVATTGSYNDLTNKPTIPDPYTLPTASATNLGGVKVDGTTITISNGVISAAAAYSLPTASTSTLGGVKIDGTSITISGGVISATPYSLPTASSTTLGGVKVDGSTITITNGVISAAASGGLTLQQVPYDLASGTSGKPAANVTVMPFVSPRAFTIPANFAGSVAKALSAATASAVFTLYKNGTAVGTFTFAAGSASATFSNQVAISAVAGDVFTLVSPTVQDLTLSDVMWTIAAYLA